MKWVNNILDLLQNTARFNADAAFRYNETSSATAMRLIALRGKLLILFLEIDPKRLWNLFYYYYLSAWYFVPKPSQARLAKLN